MVTLFAVAALSVVLSLLLTPVVRRAALRCGLLDRPDGRRKTHAQPTPLAGGLAVFIAALLAIVAALLVPNPLQERLLEKGWTLLGLLVAAVVLCGVGLADDFHLLRGRHKLLGQLLAIGVVIGFGGVVENIRLFHWQIDLGLLAIPFTVCWLLGSINSLNLLDGMDGLLSCVALMISVAFMTMAVISGHWAAACVAIALAGGLLGFLRYNLPPARIFLGDSGSMVIGLAIGVLAIQSSLKTTATIALAAPLTILTIPFFDTAAAILRRKLTGRSIYSTDRGHLHHCLLERGYSIPRVLLWVSFFCALTVLGALASLAWNNELFAILAAVTVVAILIGTRLFGYPEFILAKQALLATFASLFHRQAGGKARQIEVRLQGSVNWNVLWNSCMTTAEQLNLKTLCLDVNMPALQENYHARWGYAEDDAENPSLWRAEIPLSVLGQTVGRLLVVGERDDMAVWRKVETLTKVVENLEAAVSTITSPVVPGTSSDADPLLARTRETSRAV